MARKTIESSGSGTCRNLRVWYACDFIYIRAEIAVPLAGTEHLGILRCAKPLVCPGMRRKKNSLFLTIGPPKRPAINVLMNRRLLTGQREVIASVEESVPIEPETIAVEPNSFQLLASG